MVTLRDEAIKEAIEEYLNSRLLWNCKVKVERWDYQDQRGIDAIEVVIVPDSNGEKQAR